MIEITHEFILSCDNCDNRQNFKLSDEMHKNIKADDKGIIEYLGWYSFGRRCFCPECCKKNKSLRQSLIVRINKAEGKFITN